MDGRNNQFDPQNTQNRQVHTGLSTGLNHILQNGVTPEQFADNARQLETYSRLNTMGLQVYLQRQSQLAEKRRQDELRLIQMAQQLAAGSQPQSQRQLPQAIPQISHGRQSLSTQQTVASAIANTRNAPLQIYNHGQFYNKANTNDVASQHGQFYRSHTTDQHRARVPMTSVQQQPHYPTLNASAHFANPTVYPQCNTDRVVHPTGGAGIVPASTLHDSQVMRASYVPPKSQYPHYPGVVTTSPQARVGQGVVSGVTAGQDVGNLYPSWVKAYGVETAASMTRDILQSRQLRQVVPVTPAPTTASLDSVSVQNPQNQSQFQIMKQEPPTGVGPILLPLDPPRQEWHPEVRVISVEERLAPSQARPTALHNIVSHQLSDTDNTPLQADVTQGIAGQSELVNMSDVHNNGEVQSHYLGATASNAVLTSTDITSGLSTPLRSQPGSTQSILLASEKKSTALYTMRGLAASVQRSLNAERLGASTEPSATSGLPTVKRMRSTSAGAIDATGATKFKLSGSESHEQGPVPKIETQIVNQFDKPDSVPITTGPRSFPRVPTPQQEMVHVLGVASFDHITDSTLPDHRTAPSPEAIPSLMDSTAPQQTVDIVPMDIPLMSFSQSSLNQLSFSNRTPTPPLAATITPLQEDVEINERTQKSPSPQHAFPPCIEQAHTEPPSTTLANEDDVEVGLASARGVNDDQVRISFEVTPTLEHAAHLEARDDNSPVHGTDVFVRRSGLLDSSFGEGPGKAMGYLRAEEHSSVETRDTFQEGEGPLDKAVKTPSDRVKSPRLAEISNSSWLSKPPRKSYRKRVFYVSVPPPSDWVLRAKRKEAERKGLRSEKTGQRRNREYAGRELANRLCPRHCHWSGCQAVLNSIYSLKQHVRRHQSEVEPVGPAMTVSCQWKQCRMVCERSSLLLHLNRHVDKEITCIFDDCDERFSRVQELSVHLNSVHANDESPPCAIPRPPDLKSPATLPRTLPSYTITTRAASRPAISAERRTRLGPWVLGTVFGHLTAGSDLNSARRARRVTRLTDKALEPMFADNGNSGAVTPNSELLGQSAEYDVLEEPSVASTHLLRDLDALEVTKHLHDGTRDVVRYAINYSTSENDEVPTSSQMETEMEMETETETETGMDTEVEGLLLYTDVMMTSVS